MVTVPGFGSSWDLKSPEPDRAIKGPALQYPIPGTGTVAGLPAARQPGKSGQVAEVAGWHLAVEPRVATTSVTAKQRKF